MGEIINEKLKLDTRGLVEKFGTDKQKERFEKSGKLESKVRKAILKQVETEYESIAILKEGRSNVYILGGKRSEAVSKKDGRHLNGKWSIEYTKNMDLIVISTLEDDSIETDYAQTMRKWLLDFGLISKELYDLMVGGGQSTSVKDKAVEDLISSNILNDKDEENVLGDYLSYSKELQGQLESTLNRMAKAGIINFFPVWKAKTHLNPSDPNSRDTTVNLHEVTLSRILEKRSEMMQKHDVNSYDLIYLKNKPSVKAFEEEFSNYLANDVRGVDNEKVSIDYYWKTFAIHIKTTKKRVASYLKKYNSEVIEAYNDNRGKFLMDNNAQMRSKRKERVVELAERKDKYIKENKLKLDSDMESFGLTTSDLVDAIKFNKGYYKLFLDDLYVQKIRELEEHYQYDFNVV